MMFLCHGGDDNPGRSGFDKLYDVGHGNLIGPMGDSLG